MYQPTLSAQEARDLLGQGAQLVDVRLPHEFCNNGIPGSVNIPLPAMRQSYRQLDRATPVLLYCNTGQRSGMAKQLLEACGFHSVHNLGSFNALA